MTQGHPCIELGIVMASDVRRYAEGELLPQQQREAVEQALIDDDRARTLVFNTAPVENALRDMPETTGKLLRKAQKTCGKSIQAYKALLLPQHLPETVVRVSTIRHHARKGLFQDIAFCQRDNSLEISDCSDVTMPEGNSGKPLEKLIETATKRDSKLHARLTDAYAAPASPSLKAKIAAWIAAIHEDTIRIAWL